MSKLHLIEGSYIAQSERSTCGGTDKLTLVIEFSKQLGDCGFDIGTVIAEQCNNGRHVSLNSLVEGS
jgi:hypothetical protein